MVLLLVIVTLDPFTVSDGCRPHLVLATTCALLSWGATLLAVVQVLANSRSGLLEGSVTFSPLLQLAWAIQAAGCIAFSLSRVATLQDYGSPLSTAKVNKNLSNRLKHALFSHISAPSKASQFWQVICGPWQILELGSRNNL